MNSKKKWYLLYNGRLDDGMGGEEYYYARTTKYDEALRHLKHIDNIEDPYSIGKVVVISNDKIVTVRCEKYGKNKL